MKTNEITRFEFEGRSLGFAQKGGEWWADLHEAAGVLGYVDRRKLLNLYKRHEDEFLGHETTVLTLAAADGKPRSMRVFSPRGLEHLAILGRTPTCIRFRRWLLDVVEKLRTGSAALVTREQVEAMILMVEKTLAANYERALAEVQDRCAASLAVAQADLDKKIEKNREAWRNTIALAGRLGNELTALSIDVENATEEQLSFYARQLGLNTPQSRAKRQRDDRNDRSNDRNTN